MLYIVNIIGRNIYIIFQNSTHKSFPTFFVQPTGRSIFTVGFFIIFRKNYILGMIYLLCNAPIWKLKEILISSLLHLKEIYIIFLNSSQKSFPTFLYSLQAARFLLWVFCNFQEKLYIGDDIFNLQCSHSKTKKDIDL